MAQCKMKNECLARYLPKSPRFLRVPCVLCVLCHNVATSWRSLRQFFCLGYAAFTAALPDLMYLATTTTSVTTVIGMTNSSMMSLYIGNAS